MSINVEKKCMCGDRAATTCPGEWEPGCDLGSNPKFVRGISEDKWKCGNELAPFHPQASHVSPDYRDGWNHCYAASQTKLYRAIELLRRLSNIECQSTDREFHLAWRAVEVFLKEQA